MQPPLRFETNRSSASQNRPIDFSRRVLAICGQFLTLGQHLT